jgi:hypothetical protein
MQPWAESVLSAEASPEISPLYHSHPPLGMAAAPRNLQPCLRAQSVTTCWSSSYGLDLSRGGICHHLKRDRDTVNGTCTAGLG